MKTIFTAATPLAAILAIATLSACSTARGDLQGQQSSSGSSATGAMMERSSGGAMGMMDKESTCSMYKNMMSARTPAERQAMMDERMKGMSPEMQQRHLEMMQQQCK